MSAIWYAVPFAQRGNQAVFGEKYGIGSQSAVGQFLRGETALSQKAARGFAAGLGCKLSDFSPRLFKEAELMAEHVPAQGESGSAELAELQRVVTRLTTSGKMQLSEVHAMIAMLKAREGPPTP